MLLQSQRKISAAGCMARTRDPLITNQCAIYARQRMRLMTRRLFILSQVKAAGRKPSPAPPCDRYRYESVHQGVHQVRGYARATRLSDCYCEPKWLAFLHPMQVRYQAAPRPDRGARMQTAARRVAITKRDSAEALLVADF